MATTGSFFTLAYPLCLSMIPAQTLRVCRDGKPVPTFPDHAAGNKKAPDLFRRGFGSDDAFVRLRAHVSRAPRELGGFRGAFGVRHHGGELMREISLGVNGFRVEKQPNEVEQHIVVAQ
jgi:hypothetical protein